MQNYHDLQNTEAANVYLDKVKDNIQAVASNFSGTSFPTENLQVGMLCYRTDKKKLYQLTDTDPITWESVQSSLTFDTTPTAGSKNPVTSGGIKTALDTKLDKTGNAVSATKLQTARTINFKGALYGNVTFDGSKNTSVTLLEFEHVEAIIDLTDATKYDTDTYYPVVSNPSWSDKEDKYRCWTPIHAIKTAPWGTLGTGDYTAELKVRNNMDGWGAREAFAEILMNSCLNTNGQMPITYIQMRNCGRSVFFIRGGGKYWFSSTRDATWKLKTDTFTENGNTVAPTKTYFTPESKNTIKTLGINISGTATKATKDASGHVITDTYATKASIPTKTSELTNDSNFLTSHQNLDGYAKKSTTLSGYGITDANISDGTITLGENTITPITEHQDLSAYLTKADASTNYLGKYATAYAAAKSELDWDGNRITDTYASKASVPTKTSQLTNDSEFLNKEAAINLLKTITLEELL